MADFSIGDAIGSGFGLMSRRPVSVLAWGLTYLVIGVAAPLALFGAIAGADLLGLIRQIQPGAPAANLALVAPFNAKMMLLQPIMFVVALAAQAILSAAVFRAVLEPRNRGLAYLRLGAREWWLALLNFAARFLAAVLAVVLAVVGVGLGFGLNAAFESQHVDQAVRVCAFVAIGLVLFAVFIGICVRFSLAGPMTFADSQFRLFESWSLTRRHGWKLFGMALVVAIVGMVMVLVFEAIVAVVVIATLHGRPWEPGSLLRLIGDTHTLWTSGVGEGLVLLALVGAYAFGAIFAVCMAPWAVAYRELLPGAAPSAPRPGAMLALEPEPIAQAASVQDETAEVQAQADPSLEGHSPEQHSPEEHAPDEHAPEEHASDEHAPKEHGSDDQGHDDHGEGGSEGHSH